MNEDDMTLHSTLTLKQAVMYMLGYRGRFKFQADDEWLDFDLSDYLSNEEEAADCALSEARYELDMLCREGNASQDMLKDAEQLVLAREVDLKQARHLAEVAEAYRLLLNHEVNRVRRGKRTPLVVDEDETTRTGELRVTTDSFQEWLEEMELDETQEVPQIPLPAGEEDFDQPLGRKAGESLYVTLGLLVSLFADSSGGQFGSGQNPTVINIAKKLAEYAKQLNDGHPLHAQGKEAIAGRIEVALGALDSVT